jgi:hypothetical protein
MGGRWSVKTRGTGSRFTHSVVSLIERSLAKLSMNSAKVQANARLTATTESQ